jgi:hypothetical protein
LRTSLSSGEYLEFGTQSTPSKRNKIDDIISPIGGGSNWNNNAEEDADEDADEDDNAEYDDGDGLVDNAVGNNDLTEELTVANKGWANIKEQNISRKRMVLVTPGSYVVELRRVDCRYSFDPPKIGNPILIHPVTFWRPWIE